VVANGSERRYVKVRAVSEKICNAHAPITICFVMDL